MIILVPVHGKELSLKNLEISSTPGASVFLDGEYYGSVNPNGNFIATLSQEYADREYIQIRLENNGFIPVERTYSIENLMNVNRLRIPLSIANNDKSSQALFFGYIIIGFGFIIMIFVAINRRKQQSLSQKNRNQEKRIDTRTTLVSSSIKKPSEPTIKYKKEENTDGQKAQRDISGTKFDKYTIVSQLAEGGVATIYTALDQSGRKIALKVMAQYLNDDDMVGKFIGEGWALQEIKKKFPKAPVIDVYDYGRKDEDPNGVPFIAMELVEGRSLDFFIKNNILPHEKKINILRELASAIDAAHQCGVLHRDLSPDNILIKNSSDLTIRLIDFGVARHEVSWLKGTSVGAAFGKPEYMAPEQVEGGDLNYKVDYYSLGVLIYALFMGRPPFKHTVMYKVFEMHINAEVPKMAAEVPEHIRALVMELMRKEPEKRPDNIDQILSKLK